MMDETKWVTIDWEDCEFCGGTIEVKHDNFELRDGVDARCLDCNATGWVSVDEDDHANIYMEND